jgi:cobalt-zinc-cadmium resistance protein CzcA
MQIERTLKAKFPEIERVFARTGTAEVATDVMPPSISDGYIMLKPEKDWPTGSDGKRRNRDQLLADIRTTVEALPGNAYELSQPIQLRFNELISGVRSDVAVKLFGDDMTVLEAQARIVAAQLGKLAGATEVKIEQTGGLPFLNVDIDRDKAARYGLSIGVIQGTVSAAIGGKDAGTVFQGDRRFGIVVRLPETLRSDPAALGRLPLALPNGQGYVPLSDVATLNEVTGPNQVSRDDGRRRIVLSANAQGRPLSEVVADIRSVVQEVRLPEGYFITLGGQFQAQEEASRLVGLLSIVSLTLMFVVLYTRYKSVALSALIMVNIPLALVGAVLGLWLSGQPLSVAALVGFITLAGISVRNGILKVSHYLNLMRMEGEDFDQKMIVRGSLERLSPVLMTALVTAFALAPLLFEASRPGTEILHPVAVVIFSGLVSSTLLDTFLTPAMFWLFGRKPAERLLDDRDAEAF